MSGASTESPAREQAPLLLPAWAVGAPAVLLLGFLALLGRAGVGVQVIGLPLGAYLAPLPSVLVVGLMATTRGRLLLRSFDRSQRRVAIAVAVAVAVGLLRAAVQGMPTLLRFQDMAYLLHLPWIVVGMAAMKTLEFDDERTRVLRWLAWTLVVVLVLHWARGVIGPAEWLFEQLITSLEGLSDKPANVMKDGDRALYGIVLAALAVHLTGHSEHRGTMLVGIAGLLLGTHFVGFALGGSRGALLGLALGSVALMVQSSSRAARWTLATCAALSFAVSSAAELASVPTTADPPPLGPGIEASPPTETPQVDLPSLRERYETATGRRSITATIDQLQTAEGEFTRPSEVSWRIAIWRDVLHEWNSSWRNRLFGIGFGNEIEAMTIPGRQGYDGLNRSVHSIAFTVLVRQGLAGIASTSALLFIIILPRPRRRTVATPALFSAVTVGLFNVFFEGVQAPVVLWIIVGLMRAAPSAPELPPCAGSVPSSRVFR